jgi:hypothetical protein
MPGLDTASRVYPTCSDFILPNSGKPEFGGIHDEFPQMRALRKAADVEAHHGLPGQAWQ